MKPTVLDPVAEVLAQAQVLDAALKRRDRSKLESVLASDFTLTVGGGAHDVSRTTWLENAVGKAMYDDLEFQGRRARTFGEFVVLDAGYTWIVAGRVPDAPAQRHAIKGTVVEVWAKRQDRWQLLWRHTTRVSEEPVGT